MAETLSKAGIYFDEIDKIRILDPNVSKQTNDLKDNCKIYLESKFIKFRVTLKFIWAPLGIEEFKKITNNFVNLVENLSNEVEKQKMKAIGARNVLQTMEKQKEIDQQQMQVKFYIRQ